MFFFPHAWADEDDLKTRVSSDTELDEARADSDPDSDYETENTDAPTPKRQQLLSTLGKCLATTPTTAVADS